MLTQIVVRVCADPKELDYWVFFHNCMRVNIDEWSMALNSNSSTTSTRNLIDSGNIGSNDSIQEIA